MAAPGFWTDEQSGVLRPAITAYVNGEPMDAAKVGLMRAYLRQWIYGDGFHGPEIDMLRQRIPALTSREAIEDWLNEALIWGIDPL